MIEHIKNFFAELFKQWKTKPPTRAEIDDAIREQVSNRWRNDFLDIN